MTENGSGQLDEKLLMDNMSGLMSSLMGPDAMKKFSNKE
jgi:hypothetical protein